MKIMVIQSDFASGYYSQFISTHLHWIKSISRTKKRLYMFSKLRKEVEASIMSSLRHQ